MQLFQTYYIQKYNGHMLNMILETSWIKTLSFFFFWEIVCLALRAWGKRCCVAILLLLFFFFKKNKIISCFPFQFTDFNLLCYWATSYGNTDLALHYGAMLRECIRHQSVARWVDHSIFQLFYIFFMYHNFKKEML